MPKEKKVKAVDSLKDRIGRSNIMLITDYRGLPAKEMTQLRRHLTKSGAEYKVVKNTLALLAARQVGKEKIVDLLSGPVAIVFGYEDVVKPVQGLIEYIKNSGVTLPVKGGVMGDKILSSEDIQTLATLPAKEVLISRLVGQMLAPLQGIHGVLVAPLRGLITVLQGRLHKLEGGNN